MSTGGGMVDRYCMRCGRALIVVALIVATVGPAVAAAPTALVTAPGFVQEVAGRVGAGASNAVTFPGSNRAGDLIVVYVLWSNSDEVTVTDTNGNMYVPASAPTAWNGGRARAAVFYAANISGGANTVDVVFATPVTTFGIVYAHEYSNVAASDPLDGTTSAVGTTSTLTGAPLTTTVDGDLLFAGGASTASLLLTDPSFTTRSTRWANVTADRTVAAGVQRVTGIHDGTAWVIQLVAFKPATATTTTTSTSTTPPPTTTIPTTTTTAAPTTTTAPPGIGAIAAPLRQSTVNPHYFVDQNGKAVLLTGSHTWNDLQDWGADGAVRPLDFDAYVNMLVVNRHNFTLLWTVELPHFCNLPTHDGPSPEFDVSPMPWQRVGPGLATDGKPKFDLTRFDQSYFDRLRQRVVKLNAAGIYAGVYPFTVEWLNVFRCSNDGYPLGQGNNINGVNADAALSAVAMNAPNDITAVQDRFVEKMVDTLNDLPNVLWATSEEAPAESWWNDHQIDHIKSYESTKPLHHPVGYAAPLSGDGGLLASHADWVAPLARNSYISNCDDATPPCKVIINDSDHSYFGLWNDTEQAVRAYIWGNFTRGSQVLFMDPYEVYYPREGRNECTSPERGICSAPQPRYDNLRANLGYTRQYADRMDLIGMTPQGDRTSTGHELAKYAPDATEILVYAPTRESFTVDLSGTTETLRVEWFNPATGTRTLGPPVSAGFITRFTPPFAGDAILYLSDVALQR
jgi:hypothetical protein